jgi:hypothetical protein
MSAFEISRARSVAPFFRKRKPKERRPSAEAKREKEAPGYLDKVRSLPCCVCGAPPRSEAHHLKSAGRRGMGQKAANRWSVPLCSEHHTKGTDAVERIALPAATKEAAWFRSRGISCYDLAAALYLNSHSIESMLLVLRSHMEGRG